MGLFTKLIFITLIIGLVLTGFVKFGSEIQTNSNLDSGTNDYLNSINKSIKNIENIDVKTTNISTGSEDSFAKQYLEAKEYSKSASSMVGVFGDTPNILISTLGLEDQNTSWLTNYFYIGVAVLLFIVFFTTLFGTGRL